MIRRAARHVHHHARRLGGHLKALHQKVMRYVFPPKPAWYTSSDAKARYSDRLQTTSIYLKTRAGWKRQRRRQRNLLWALKNDGTLLRLRMRNGKGPQVVRSVNAGEWGTV